MAVAGGENLTRASAGRLDAPDFQYAGLIGFTSARDGNSEIYVMGSDGDSCVSSLLLLLAAWVSWCLFKIRERLK